MKPRTICILLSILFFIITIICLVLGLLLPFLTIEFIPATNQDFINEIKKINCEVVYYPKEENSIGAKSYIITKETCAYYITYADITSTEKEKEYLSNIINMMNHNKGTSAEITHTNKYYFYSVKNDKYSMIVKNDNTYIYAEVNKKDKIIIDRLLTNLNYNFKPNEKYFNFLKLSFISLIITIIFLIFNLIFLFKNKEVTN